VGVVVGACGKKNWYFVCFFCFILFFWVFDFIYLKKKKITFDYQLKNNIRAKHARYSIGSFRLAQTFFNIFPGRNLEREISLLQQKLVGGER
jgi:hypothetical protein